MPPYLITSTEDSVPLFELEDGRFQMLKSGPIAEFASGYQYLLLGRILSKYFKSLDVPQVTYQPVVIMNRVTGEQIRSHTRVFVHRTIRQDEIKSLSLEGRHLLVMNGEHFFVSPTLKFALEANEFPYLQFTEGLSAFASAA